jgi:cytidine deaminase
MATARVSTSLKWDVLVTIEHRTRTAMSPLGRCRPFLVELVGKDPTATGSRGEN